MSTASTSTNSNVQFALPTAEGVQDALAAIRQSCKDGKWTLIAPDGRVWQNESPLIVSACLLAEVGGHMKPFDKDMARILNDNREWLADEENDH